MGIKTDEKIVNYIRKKMKRSHCVVVVLGIEMLVEGGGSDLDSSIHTLTNQTYSGSYSYLTVIALRDPLRIHNVLDIKTLITVRTLIYIDISIQIYDIFQRYIFL